MPFSPRKNQKLRYFAASNSAGGFRCYYDDIFPTQKFERLFIIKGGPGTGKSYLLQKAAAEAEKSGFTVEYYYCSSDPLSLDGIAAYPAPNIGDMFGKRYVASSFAMLDGTAPHTRDTTCPGGGDEIINLGEFWNSDALTAKRADIDEHTYEKAECFTRAYEYLQVANELADQIKRLVLPAVNTEKMRGALGRVFKGMKPGKGFICAPRPQHALSMSGPASFDTFKGCAVQNYYVSECFDTGYLLFDEILRIAAQKQLLAVCSPSPLCAKHLDGVYLPEAGVAFTLCEGRPNIDINEKIINMERFVDSAALSKMKNKLRAAKKHRDAMLNSALMCLADARREHYALEKIYMAAMDFSRKDAASEQLVSRLIKR